MELSKLKKGEIVLVTTSSTKYAATNIEILKYYLNDLNSYGIYVTVNTPSAILLKSLVQKGVNTENLFVIDAITPGSSEMQRSGNVVFVGSPSALTDISISADSAVKSIAKKDKFLFLDSISTLVLYNESESVTKFAHFLINKMKEWGISGAIISLEKETDEKMLSQLSQFCDKVIDAK
mgnify:CR=1 FL=1